MGVAEGRRDKQDAARDLEIGRNLGAGNHALQVGKRAGKECGLARNDDGLTVISPDDTGRENITRITFAGVLHGFALERTSEVLRKAGLNDFRIRIGNDQFAQGRVGTRHWFTAAPNTRKPEDEPMQVYLTSQAAMTVSDSDHFVLRNGKRYHDGLDPRTGMPAEGTVQATVIGSDPTMAGAMAHALLVLGPKAGLAMLAHDKQAEGFVVDATGKIFVSPAMTEYAHLPAKMPVE